VDNFLRNDESDYIIDEAGPSVRQSDVVTKDADVGKSADTWRTSENIFFQSRGRFV
jgi:hypothetical protein